ncbi:MAG: hypothetical protein II774_06505, partial [Lachnospiraceae bacterium]|nr:hypothetical protein [Lachnospiraceae bacterium]
MEKKDVGFGTLAYEALPEMWSFQLLSAAILAVPASLLTNLISAVASTGGGAITSADLKALFLSWRFPVILFLGILLVFLYVSLGINQPNMYGEINIVVNNPGTEFNPLANAVILLLPPLGEAFINL